MMNQKPILITGSHRSGTTWVGRMLAADPSIAYIHEPFSITDSPSRGICNTEFKYWFTYITQENERKYYKAFNKMVNFQYDLLGALKSAKSLNSIRNIGTEYKWLLEHRFQGSRLLLKDPIAFFSSEWLAQTFNMDVIIIVRHPAAFVSSIKKLNWVHPFSDFLNQNLLMEKFLFPFEAEIRDYANQEYPVFDQAILLWKLIYHTAIDFQKKHQNWIFIRHEDVSEDPLLSFQNLYKTLNLNLNEQARKTITEYCCVFNPVDSTAPVGSEETLKRNSQLNVWNWKKRLSTLEIETIRSRVEPISKFFYSDESW